MLDLDPNRPVASPRDAATLMVLRDRPGGGLELFCVRRHAASAFMGGVVVFPGGKLDEADADPRYRELSNGAASRSEQLSDDAAQLRALLICVCRESLEEAAIIPTMSPIAHEEALGLRSALEAGESLVELLHARGLKLATDRLIPFGRWMTPEAEQRRFDARFFMTRLPEGQRGHHDERETTSSLWASPEQVLTAYEQGQLSLAPPTIRTFELLRDAGDAEAALAIARTQCLAPICPRFVPQDPPMLVLPGDPLHEVREVRVAGPSRFVLRGERFVSENP